jgi:hypothetical protein
MTASQDYPAQAEQADDLQSKRAPHLEQLVVSGALELMGTPNAAKISAVFEPRFKTSDPPKNPCPKALSPCPLMSAAELLLLLVPVIREGVSEFKELPESPGPKMLLPALITV